jgi:hypothetical protein
MKKIIWSLIVLKFISWEPFLQSLTDFDYQYMLLVMISFFYIIFSMLLSVMYWDGNQQSWQSVGSDPELGLQLTWPTGQILETRLSGRDLWPDPGSTSRTKGPRSGIMEIHIGRKFRSGNTMPATTHDASNNPRTIAHDASNHSVCDCWHRVWLLAPRVQYFSFIWL